MAACISSLGCDQYYSSKNKFDNEVVKLPHKRYFDFSDEINDQLDNIHNNNKRLKYIYDDHQYSFKKGDDLFKINTRIEFSNNILPCLKMVGASLYLPKENPMKPLDEDAHFIHESNQPIGVAVGVGGWAKEGIDAGIYRESL
ncbi:hypothetical protein P3S67_021429 [Capsicum chacoense]